jgi:hypothetical protein
VADLVQLGFNATDALARLRGYGFVQRRLVFTEEMTSTDAGA